MAPFIVLVAVSVLARLAGALGVDPVDTWAEALAAGLAAMFLLTAGAHFTQPRRRGLVAIVPPRVPRPALVVTLTGIAELAGAVGLLVAPEWFPGVRATAAACLAVLLVAMFPANVYAARAPRAPQAPRTPLALRTALQVVFLSAAVAVAMTSSP